MSRIILFSDLHVHAHKRRQDRLNDCLRCLEWVFQTALDKNIKNVVFGGDLFQSRESIDIMTYHLTFKILEKYCSNLLNLWLLLGNHDMWSDKWDISSVEPLSALAGITFVNTPCTLDIDGYPVDFLPYTKEPIEHVNKLKKGLKNRKTNKVLVGHIAIDNAQLTTLYNTRSDVVIEHDGEMTKVSADIFDEWDKVWLGHYHGSQKIGKVEYVGSPLQLNFGEAFQHKHIIIYNLQDGETEYIRNTFSPQHFIIPESDIGKYDIEKNFIRLEVDHTSSTDLISLKKDIQQLNPGSLEIVNNKQNEQIHIIDDAKAILYKEDEMLEKYVDQVFANDAEIAKLDKQTLISFGKDCCKDVG